MTHKDKECFLILSTISQIDKKRYTSWSEELGSYILTERGKKLSERDMINIIGDLEHMMEYIYEKLIKISYPFDKED